MRTDHLTFGQLFKLYSPANLVRVTQAYEKMLARRWPCLTSEPFVVSRAERVFLREAAPWKRLLLWMRSPELFSIVRRAADEAQPLHVPGGRALLASINLGILPQAKVEAVTRAHAISVLCRTASVPCSWNIVERPWGNTLEVYADTNAIGVVILTYRHGLTFNTLRAVCEHLEVSADGVFRWVPEEHRAANGKVNPITFPMDTPDCAEIAHHLVAE